MGTDKTSANEVTVVIEKKDEGGYQASIEGVQGLVAEGETIVKARKNLWDTIKAIRDKLFSGKPFKITEKFKLFFPKDKQN